MRELSINENAKLKCVKEYDLVQYTPHIHFQSDEEGACLRASEVKPKLDKFLLKYLGKDLEKKIPEEWKTKSDDDVCAFNYKMSISGIGNPDIINNFQYSTYFGNMGDAKDKQGVMYKNGLKLTIITAVSKPFPENQKEINSLLDLIDYCLPAFFALTCFGTRSTKGWGSYGIKGREITNKYLHEFVKVFYETSVIKNMSRRKEKGFDALEEIRIISNMMKAGINFRGYYKGRIYCYFLEGIKSDKAYMKSHIFARENDEKKYRYVRAMLGLAENVEFKDRERKGTVKIKDEKNEIARFNNPVHFIPDENRIIILPTPISKKLSERSFEFSKGGTSGTINTPKLVEKPEKPNPQAGEFDLQAFLDWFVKQVEDRVDEKEAPDDVKRIMKNGIRKAGGSHE